MNINLKKANSGVNINWLKVKWIQVTKECPESIFFNTGFDPNDFIEAKLQPSNMRGRSKTTGKTAPLPLYSSKLPISEAKKADLLSLCKSGIIPSSYHSFYEDLKVGKSVMDKLPESDIEDEDQDS